MKVLFDEDVPAKLARSLSRHDEGRPFAVLIMSAINWPVVRPHIHKISLAIDEARPGTLKTIDCGVFIARLKRDCE